jgi:hypothetical protein
LTFSKHTRNERERERERERETKRVKGEARRENSIGSEIIL